MKTQFICIFLFLLSACGTADTSRDASENLPITDRSIDGAGERSRFRDWNGVDLGAQDPSIVDPGNVMSYPNDGVDFQIGGSISVDAYRIHRKGKE